MKSLILNLVIIVSVIHSSYESKNREDPGEPLILTEYLEQGKIEEARSLATVPSEVFLGIQSYSGYLTVNKESNSNSFFWFIPATEVDYRTAPVLLWLQGGPGAPSSTAAFVENGPFEMINETNIKLTKFGWTAQHSVLYIDNPVGTGFSFTDGRWCTTEEEIGEDLYTALIQFFQLFPELQQNEFFVTGESYAGKYVPALSYTIHTKNQDASLKINMKGIAIGNGLIDPVHQLDYAEYLSQIGLIDWNVKKEMEELQNKAIKHVEMGEYLEAFNVFDTIINGDITPYPTLFKNATGFDYYLNFLFSSRDTGSQSSDFVQQNHVRKALHVGNVSFASDPEVEESLREDFLRSVAPWLEVLLDNYRVLIYSGQLDIIVAYPLTINFLRHLNFSGSQEYETAERHLWMLDNEIAGYSKQAGNLTEVFVRNAGHLVPTDQPGFALDLITKFVRNENLY